MNTICNNVNIDNKKLCEICGNELIAGEDVVPGTTGFVHWKCYESNPSLIDD